MNHILVVEDDAQLGAQIQENLESEGYEVSWVKDGDEAARLDPDSYQLIILDLMLPGTYGLDILKRFRRSSDVPVLILSARDHSADKVRSFQLGADDYVTKPFWPQELLERVKARLRRPLLSVKTIFKAGNLSVDLEARQVHVNAHSVELTRVEFELLRALAERPGHALSRHQLVEEALDPAKEGSERTLDVHISRLRKKLGAEGKRIATVWGIGYRLEER